MKKCAINWQMADNESSAFVTGISRSGEFTEEEFKFNKHHDLIEGIQIIEGCHWSFSIDWFIKK